MLTRPHLIDSTESLCRHRGVDVPCMVSYFAFGFPTKHRPPEHPEHLVGSKFWTLSNNSTIKSQPVQPLLMSLSLHLAVTTQHTSKTQSAGSATGAEKRQHKKHSDLISSSGHLTCSLGPLVGQARHGHTCLSVCACDTCLCIIVWTNPLM